MNKKNAYSPYKMMHHKDKLCAAKEGALVIPLFVQWDLTNVCNLDCSFCFYRNSGFKLEGFDDRDAMPTEKVLEIMQDLKDLGVKAIEWTGGGEPTLHPKFLYIIRQAKSMGFKQALVTNGTCISDEVLEELKDFEWVRVSIDAATRPTYKKIKGVDMLEDALESMRKLKKIARPHNVLGLSFIVCPDNHKEIFDAAIRAKAMGVDNIRFSLAMTSAGEKLFDGIWEKCLDGVEKAKGLGNDDFTVFAFTNRIKDLAKEELSDWCYYHHLVGVITPRGLYPCCRLKYDERFLLGDFKDKSFADIWFGQKRRVFIQKIADGCPFECWMTEKNKVAEYIVKPDQMHVNYV